MSAPPSRFPSSVDRTHALVLLACCAGAAAVLLRPIDQSERLPSTSGLARASVAGTPAPELSLGELQIAIARLERWVTAAYAGGATPLERVLGVQGLGRNKANLEHQSLVACLRDWSPESAAGQAPDALAASAILLEAGVAPAERLTLAGGERRLQELVQQALDSARSTPPDEDAELGWQVQLLALAVASGLTQYEDELAQRSEHALGRLEREYRAFDARFAETALDPVRVRELARERERDPGADAERAAALQLSAAVFLASGVSPEAGLEARVRRHLSAVLVRHERERAIDDVLLHESRGAATTARRVIAFEQFGRLAQALFMAHVAWRETPDAPFPPALTPVMRQTARDLMALLDQLERLGVYDTPYDGKRPELLQATVHALRGLRTARAAAS
jgi:hypothetical protein